MEKVPYIVELKLISNDLDSRPNFSIEIIECFYDKFPDVLPNESFSINPGDKLYFVSGVKIPRVKLKNITMDYGAEITRDIKSANKIIGLNNKSDYFSYYSNYTTNESCGIAPLYEILELADNTEDYENYIEKSAIEKLRFVVDKIELLIKENSLQKSDFKLTFNWNTIRRLNSIQGNIFSKIFEKIYDNYNYFSAFQLNHSYNDLYQNLANKELYSEVAVLENINGDDAISIDEEKYKQLCQMLDSSDTDNHTLAMEIMANFDYNSSYFFLCLLFTQHNYTLRYNKTKNHVNFKSLLTYMDLTPANMGMSYTAIPRFLFNKKLLTEYNINYLLTNHFGEYFYCKCDEFKIDTVTLNTESLEMLNKNFRRRFTEDYIEKVEEVEEVETPEFKVEESNFNWI